MAVNPIEPIPKSQPDNSKLNTFTGHTVTVTKHTAPRNSVGQMVVATQPMKLNAILELMTSIPMAHGPGFYRFTVSDTGGTGDDVWMVKLGPDIQEGSPMANVIPMGPTGQPPTGEGMEHLGHGFYYNPNHGTLTTPWRSLHAWKPGDELPKQPTTPSQQAPANPWWQGLPQMQNPAMPGWGNFPAVNDSSSDKIRELETRLADQQRQREADENRAEIRRIADEAQKRSEAQAAQFALLVEKLTAKPSGPTEAEQRLERELADQRRRTEEREREDRLRAEIKATQDNMERLVRDQNANKQDPMLPLLMTMLTSTQTQAQESVKAIQASTQAAAAASERSTQELVRQLSTATMTPMQIVQLIQSSKGDGAEMGRLMLEATKETMAMQKGVYEQLLDVAGQSGQPAWVGLVQEAMSKIGAVGEAIASRTPAPPPAPPPPMTQRQPPAQMRPGAAAPQARPAIQAGPVTAADMRDQAAAQVPHLVPGPAQVVHAAPMNGASTAAPVAAAQVVSPQIIPPTRKPRKAAKHRRGGRRSRSAEPVAPADEKKGFTIEEMRELPTEQVREGVSAFPDDVFFGALYPNVLQLRASNLAPATVAGYILQAREAALQQGIMSGAIEILLAEQLEVLTERLFPDAKSEYHAAVVQALADAIGAADPGEEGDDDEDDDEEGADTEA